MAAVSVDIGSVGSAPYMVFHALGLEWVFYSGQYFKTSVDAGVTFTLRQQIPNAPNGSLSLFYDSVNNRIHCAWTRGNTVSYLSGVPAADGTVKWGTMQSAYVAGTSSLSGVQIVCDSNGYPWMTWEEVSLFLTAYYHVAKSSTKDGTWTQAWQKTNSLYYPGSASNPDFNLGLLVPDTSGGMFYPYSETRYNNYSLNPVDADAPDLFYRTIDSSGNFSDPPTKIAGHEPNMPTGGVVVGTDMHIVWKDQASQSIMHAVNNAVDLVQAGVYQPPSLMYDTTRNRLLCFWTNANHIYYKAYDLTSGTWDATSTDWLDETANGGVTAPQLQLDPVNNRTQERTPVTWQSQAYVWFALSNLNPPTVKTLPATAVG